MDLISDVLGQSNVKARMISLLSLKGDQAFGPSENGEAVFHLVSKGSLLVTHQGTPIRLNKGEMIFFPKGPPHLLSSSQGAEPVAFSDFSTKVVLDADIDGKTLNETNSNDGPETELICARFIISRSMASQLVQYLPEQITLHGADDYTTGSIIPLLRRIALEAKSEAPGAFAALDMLLNMLFIQFLRSWMQTMPPSRQGWIRGLQDRHIAAALFLLHKNPAKNWSVQELAAQAGMSRSSFSARFTRLVGAPPLKHLTDWRMYQAAQILESDLSRPLCNVALDVGYESEASFSVAFKRHYGKAPGTWRNDGILASTKIPKVA